MTAPYMTCDDAQALMSDALDGTLSDRQRAPYEGHLSSCADCRVLAQDLGTIRDDAASLPTLSPSHDLWSGIEARLGTPVLSLGEHRQGRVARWTSRQVAVAAAMLVAVTAGGTWMAATRSAAPLTQAAARTEFVLVADQKGIDTYEGEIAKLKDIVKTRRGELDSATVAVLEKNLNLIDRAIAESKAALAADPASTFLAGRLNHAYDTKLELLRSAALLPSRS
jgi:anti-sigma factor RsiW